MNKFQVIESESHNEKWLEALDLFRSGDKAGALFRLKKLASEGCAPALVEIGNIYELGGGGVDQDLEKAKEWYNRSIETIDDPKAHLSLGRLYFRTGESTEDYLKAVQHFSILAEHKGDMAAQFALGLLYESGLAGTRDLAQAARYYKDASLQGHALASKNLALIKMKSSFFKGVFLWLKSCWSIWKITLKNPNDRRLGVR